MRILLQKKDSGLYFKDMNTWCRDGGEATDFLSSTRAIDFCAANKIGDVHLVLKFDEQHFDIVLPVFAQQQQGTGTGLSRAG